MLIWSRQRHNYFENAPTIAISGAPIKLIPLSKFLGVHIDKNMSWIIHIETISKKIASGIGALKRIRYFVPSKTLQFILNSLIQSHFEYCSALWGNCNKTLAHKFQKLQNRPARVLTFSSYHANADRLFEKLRSVKLATQRQTHKVVMLYKSVNGLSPDYLRTKFVVRGWVSNCSLRDTVAKFAFPFPALTIQKIALVTVVRWHGIASLWIFGRLILWMPFALAAVGSFHNSNNNDYKSTALMLSRFWVL